MEYAKLRGAIREKFRTQGAFARAMEMHSATLSKKLSGQVEWTQTEIVKSAKLLKIPVEQIHEYFFTV